MLHRILEYDGTDYGWPHLPWRCELDEHITLVAATRKKLLEDLDFIDKHKEGDNVAVKSQGR